MIGFKIDSNELISIIKKKGVFWIPVFSGFCFFLYIIKKKKIYVQSISNYKTHSYQ